MILLRLRPRHLALMLLLASACSSLPEKLAANQARVDYDILERLPDRPIDYRAVVRPILESRCVVCHGCYDAPCQLKLSSGEGIARGASKEVVYDGARISAAEPARLFIDALTTAQWRKKGFHTVVNEPKQGKKNPHDNLARSVAYRMLRLKQLNPQPLTGMLDPAIDTSLDRKQTCPTLEEFDDYAKKRPKQGMPFALPNLAQREYKALVWWLAQGASVPPAPAPSAFAAQQIDAWERFLNGTSSKQRLLSRYLYEHWFLAHLYFASGEPRTYYTLVRSSSPPGRPIVPITSRRPYGDPGSRFYYRIRPMVSSIVAKTHLPYELSQQRMDRLRELFLQPEYTVKKLPGYDPKSGANPFKVFAALPLKSRYQFLLDNARFFIEGFIKGPVCRGQIALNVIEDRFWVFFLDPEAPLSANTDYIDKLAEYLALPTEMENNLKLVSSYGHYLELENRYLEARHKAVKSRQPLPVDRAVSLLWNGEGQNPNAALTVYRHYDSASVDFGLVGTEPETAWIIDYPLLERIHYLLVAGYDVYGNVGHQLNTRRHMDVLRMEAENYLLVFLPAKIRRATHESWYTGIRKGQADDLKVWWMDVEVVNGYRSDKPLHELYQHITRHLGPMARPARQRPCRPNVCESDERRLAIAKADQALSKLGHMKGKIVEFLPDVAFVRVKLGGDPADDLAYTLVSDKSYKSVSSMFTEEKVGQRRDYSNDRQTVVPWLEGAYPDFFYLMELAEVESFAQRYDAIQNRRDYEKFIGRFGIRRTNPDFWQQSDWFNAQALREQPMRAGIFDLNRYQNR